jgi:hypothetical protein
LILVLQGDADSFYFPRASPAGGDDNEELLRSGSGDAPPYPDWVYRLVILPRLLWQEQQRAAQMAEAARSASVTWEQPHQSPAFDGQPGRRRFESAFDFEWWLDADTDTDEGDAGLRQPRQQERVAQRPRARRLWQVFRWRQF